MLAEVGVKDLDGLAYKDYTRLQSGYFRLVRDGERNPATQKSAAKRLAARLNFSAAEILTMSYADMVWWLTD